MAKDKDGNEVVTQDGDKGGEGDQGDQGDKGTNKPGPTPAVDASQIKGAVKEVLEEFLAAGNPSDEGLDTLPARNTVKNPVATDTIDPVKAAIDPIVRPMVDEVGLAAESAKDAAIFYSTNPEAHEFRKEIEGAFKKLQDQNTPFTRDAVFKWFKGEHLEKFVQKRIDADKKKADEAEHQTTVDTGGRPAVKNVVVTPETPDDDLNKALEGTTF